MKYDNLLKEILQDAMPDVLQLLGLPEAVKYLTVELPRRHRADPPHRIAVQEPGGFPMAMP